MQLPDIASVLRIVFEAGWGPKRCRSVYEDKSPRSAHDTSAYQQFYHDILAVTANACAAEV